uniref:Uncharacterized protein n=1 Tax=Caenorhabditis japonica TaxID=281687 RepID=A0A8R1DQS4_CAEJA
MPVVDYLFLIQNTFLFVVIFCPALFMCKGKNKSALPPPGKGSSETLAVKSAIKPLPPAEPKSQGAPEKQEKKDAKSKEMDSKDGEKKEPDTADAEKEKKNVEKSQKPFPKFEMPTSSTKHKKDKENEKDKNEKIKKGFYQEKSDEDDTLEKVDSLRVEQSDRTKRGQKGAAKK